MTKSTLGSTPIELPKLSVGGRHHFLQEGVQEPLWIWPEAPAKRVSLMGILNVTPDSFFDGGRFHSHQEFELVERATSQGLRLMDEGALYLDIGGESSRPGAEQISLDEELSRVIPVIENLIAERPECIISIDTIKPKVAEAALDVGARIINDIQGLRDPKMRALVAERRAGVVIMHMRGTPKTMQEGNLHSEDIVQETYQWLETQYKLAIDEGICDEQIAIDLGIGFGKTVAQNLTLIRALSRFKNISAHLLVGASRKSFIGAITGVSADERLPGSLVTITEAMNFGGNIFRVHDVASSRQALMVAESIRQGSIAAPPIHIDELIRY